MYHQNDDNKLLKDYRGYGLTKKHMAYKMCGKLDGWLKEA